MAGAREINADGLRALLAGCFVPFLVWFFGLAGASPIPVNVGF